MILSEFLNTIYTNDSGIVPLVYIYRDDIAKIPNDENLNIINDRLICVHRSAYMPRVTLNEEIAKSNICRILWSKHGFVVTVDWKLGK